MREQTTVTATVYLKKESEKESARHSLAVRWVMIECYYLRMALLLKTSVSSSRRDSSRLYATKTVQDRLEKNVEGLQMQSSGL